MKIKRLLQHSFSRFVGLLANTKQKQFKTWAIKRCIRKYYVDMSDVLITDINQYKTFNEFFTRQLKPGSRPLPENQQAIVSPVDGTISQLGKISENRIFQAKGFDFTTQELLADESLATQFNQGDFLTAYLAPKDYHRIHMPFSGKLLRTIYIPGDLFSVCTSNVAKVPRIFARNERLVCHFETTFGHMAVVLVGAINVSSIHTAWAGLANSSVIDDINYADENINIARGAELGYFQMGSTVIVLFAANKISWLDTMAAEASLRMGQGIGLGV